MTPTTSPAPATCGPACGCTPAASVPIACTLGADDVRTRLAEWAAVLDTVTHRTPIAGGLRLAFSPAVDTPELARLATAERGCCAFYRFALTFDERGTALEVTAPEDAAVVLASLFGDAT